eukprot:TRINITY_DN31595_c1_g1_i4.p1 TRINITY_DN31595_c1_g1~~TRINITY_DN31595_c1_g1_i4.p1  ORF type:complete len:363 (-),score=38.15 TRINITY_DN31595_c1_g1_i4:94-1182(-)
MLRKISSCYFYAKHSRQLWRSFATVPEFNKQQHELRFDWEENPANPMQQLFQQFVDENKFELTPCLSAEEIQDLCETCGIRLNRLLAVKMLIFPPDVSLLLGKLRFNFQEVIKKCNVGYVLSWDGEFYPGTNKRVVLWNGKGADVMNCFAHFLPVLHIERLFRLRTTEKVQGEIHEDLQIVLVIPDYVAGDVIGPENSTLDDIQQESGVSKLFVQKRQSMLPMVQDRLFYLCGSPTSILKCTAKIIGRICAGENYVHYMRFQEKHPSEHTEIKWINRLVLNALQQNLLGQQIKYKVKVQLNQVEQQKLQQGEDLMVDLNKYVRRLQFANVDGQTLEFRGGYTSVQRALGVSIARMQKILKSQ